MLNMDMKSNWSYENAMLGLLGLLKDIDAIMLKVR